MKKALLLVFILAIFLMMGCVGGIKIYTDSGQTIGISVNQEFVIALGSNQTSGHSWQGSYDKAMLELVEKTYRSEREDEGNAVGIGGGVEFFRFKGLVVGKTKITLTYKRPWEEESVDQKVFTVNIK
ncbi:protease inhibitor I42 family protein [Chloroflexota bacterium]